MVFETPEVEVGDVYPLSLDYEQIDFWQLHKQSNIRNEKERSLKARVLNFGGSVTKKAKKLTKAFEKRMRTNMKWYPADMARKAKKQIQLINPDYRYKIFILRDTGCNAPPMPDTPSLTPSPISVYPNAFSVLMNGAKQLSDKKREKKAKSQKKMKI